MSMMMVSLVIGCRVQCTFCPQSLLMTRFSKATTKEKITFGNPVIMDFETFKTCIDKIPKSVSINFGGYSEPCLHPEYVKYMIYAHEQGHQISVYSTLVGMKIEDIDLFKNIPFRRFKVHLPDEESYAKIAVNKKFLAVLKKLHSTKIKNLEYMTMGTQNNKIKDIIGKNILPDFMNDRAGNLNVGGKTARKSGPLLCRNSQNTNGNRLDSNVLLPNGDVCMCTCDYGMDFVIGNLVTSNYESLFKSDIFLDAERRMSSQDEDIMCRTCEYAIPDTKINRLKSTIGQNRYWRKIHPLLLYKKRARFFDR